MSWVYECFTSFCGPSSLRFGQITILYPPREWKQFTLNKETTQTELGVDNPNPVPKPLVDTSTNW
jgi:predicted NACHT family NTPase